MCFAPRSIAKALGPANPIALLKNPKKALDPRRVVSALTPTRSSPSQALKGTPGFKTILGN